MKPPEGMILERIKNDPTQYVAIGRAFYTMTLSAQAFLEWVERGSWQLTHVLSGRSMPRWRRAEMERRIRSKYCKRSAKICQRRQHVQTPAASKMHADYRRKKR